METAKGKTREETINRLADRIDSFEKYTQPHSRLMAVLATRLARRCGLQSSDVAAVTEAAMLHDVGLMKLAPAYSSHPGPLSFEVRLDLWRHSVIGERQMSDREAGRHAQLLVRWHHEWWNGSGYPDMLAFEGIPIGARIIRAVELYSALVSDRPYRAALGEEQALEALASSAGIECDPYVVKALLALLEELRDPAQPVAVEEIASPGAGVTGGSIAAQPLTHSLDGAEPESNSILAGASSVEPVQLTDAVVNHDPAQQAERSGDVARDLVPEAFEPPQTPSNARESETLLAAGVSDRAMSSAPPPADLLLRRAQSDDASASDVGRWRGWRASQYNKRPLLGFQVSVLRQIEFRSIAVPFWNDARLDWYLKAWRKLIFANDPRAWAAAVARARVEATEPPGEDVITRVLHDVYVPGVKLANPDLVKWFGETDAWWMDNLRRNADGLDDQLMRAQVLALGLLTGDYALSFDEGTRELRRPLTTVFWRLAGRALGQPAGHPNNRSSNQPVEDFIRQARADLLFLSLPSAHRYPGGAEARSDWRESWVTGATRDDSSERVKPSAPPQSRQTYLASIDRLLRSASNFRTWAIEYQEPGLATAQDIFDLIKEYRPVRATHSKDVSEVAGGLRHHIIVGEKPAR